MARVLLVDDDASVRFTVKEFLTEMGHEPLVAASGPEALGLVDQGPDAVITDLSMPEMDGLTLLGRIHERDAALPVILLTAHGNEKVAVQAIKAGAYDYCAKPFDYDDMQTVLERAIEARRLRVQNRQLAAEKAIGRRIIGSSAPMKRILDAVARVAPKDVTVLVRGETGTGKELIASLLHAQSRRADKPLVRFNCAAIPGELAEAELFGHARGAFTGAVQQRPGFFKQADGGTLVLDEIGELPLAVQAKLLRALQEGEIQPVGSGRVERVDVRIVAATNRDLLAESTAGRFREDLYYRLNVVELLVPPLRARREDIGPLAQEFARTFSERFGSSESRLSPALVEKLSRAEWPGNVRQLENTVARIVALGSGGVIGPEAFESAPAESAPAPLPAAEHDEQPPVEGGPTLREQVEAFERSVIARALGASGGNQSEAARRLGTSRVTLIDKIRKYGLHGHGTTG